jgi:hypothetical protein
MNNIPGLMKPTTISYPTGANSPATAAKAMNDANNLKLHNINQMAAGSKRRRHRGGDNSQVTVPVIKPIYPQQNGTGTDTTSQQANISKYSMQGASWSANDSQATKMGGSRRRHKKGGNPNWSWPCYSGGKSRRKSRKNKKRTRRHRH